MEKEFKKLKKQVASLGDILKVVESLKDDATLTATGRLRFEYDVHNGEIVADSLETTLATGAAPDVFQTKATFYGT